MLGGTSIWVRQEVMFVLDLDLDLDMDFSANKAAAVAEHEASFFYFRVVDR